jgi:hypothetical protein
MKVKIFTVSDLIFHECKECGETHLPFMPHDKDSLYYRLEFYEKNGRYPTWEDAVAHCPEEIKEVWKRELKKLGVWTDTEEEGK